LFFLSLVPSFPLANGNNECTWHLTNNWMAGCLSRRAHQSRTLSMDWPRKPYRNYRHPQCEMHNLTMITQLHSYFLVFHPVARNITLTFFNTNIFNTIFNIFTFWVLHPVAHLSNWFLVMPSIATKFSIRQHLHIGSRTCNRSVALEGSPLKLPIVYLDWGWPKHVVREKKNKGELTYWKLCCDWRHHKEPAIFNILTF
jgi:hypothetical protein